MDGTSFADTLTGSSVANELSGGFGNDTLDGGGGAEGPTVPPIKPARSDAVLPLRSSGATTVSSSNGTSLQVEPARPEATEQRTLSVLVPMEAGAGPRRIGPGWTWDREGEGSLVVGTGVDPVTSRFSGARSAN